MSISLTNGQQVPDSSIIFYTTVVIDDGLLMSTPINLVQYDTSLAVICFRILEGDSQYNPSNSAQINFRMKKPDGHGVYNPVLGKDSSGNVYVLVTAQMTASYGTGTMSIEIQEDESTKYTKSAPIYISENPVNDAQIESSDEYKSIAEIVDEVNKVSGILINNEEQINSIYNNIEPIKNVSENISYIENISSDINDITIVSNNISYITTTAENIDTIKDASSAADRAAQSATQAGQSAQNASQSASNALTYSNQANSYKNEAQSYSNNASDYASKAASSASAASDSASQAAESALQASNSANSMSNAVEQSLANAQSAQQAANSASSSADRAEDAAQRAEQIADFDPADFATAAQGQKADSAVQSVNGVKPDGSGNVVLDITTGTVRSVNGNEPDGEGNVQLNAGDVGAATDAQGALAETAVQPAALESYALKSELPTTPADIGAATAAQGAKADTAVQSVNGEKPDSSGNVQIDITTGTVKSVNNIQPDSEGNVQLTPSNIGAATQEQGSLASTAVQPSDLSNYAKKTDIPTTLPNPASLTIMVNGYTRATYDGSASRNVNIETGSGGMSMTLLWTNNNPTSMSYGENIYISGLSGYDLIGIIPIANLKYGAGTDCCGMQIFKVSESTVILSGVSYRGAGPEVQSREIYIKPNSNTVMMGDASRFNSTESLADARACIPYFIYGIKF